MRRAVRLLLTMALCGPASEAADVQLPIPPIPVHIDVEGRPLAVTVSGTIAPVAAGQSDETLRVKLDADLADLQRNLTELLRSQLNQNERCGQRLSVESATLAPASPSGALTANLHVEKWGCAKAFGKEIVKKLAGGDGVVGVKLTPQVDDHNALRLDAEVTSMDATGQLGDMLHSGPVGDALKEKIRHSLVSALGKITNLKETLPPALQEMVVIRGAEFHDGGSGNLVLALTSEVKLPADQARALLDRLNLSPPQH
jgi:hypothetical protein